MREVLEQNKTFYLCCTTDWWNRQSVTTGTDLLSSFAHWFVSCKGTCYLTVILLSSVSWIFTKSLNQQLFSNIGRSHSIADIMIANSILDCE